MSQKEYGRGSLIDAKLEMIAALSCIVTLFIFQAADLLLTGTLTFSLVEISFALVGISSFPHIIRYFYIKKHTKDTYTEEEENSLEKEKRQTALCFLVCLVALCGLFLCPTFFAKAYHKTILTTWCVFYECYIVFCYHYERKKYEEYLGKKKENKVGDCVEPKILGEVVTE